MPTTVRHPRLKTPLQALAILSLAIVLVVLTLFAVARHPRSAHNMPGVSAAPGLKAPAQPEDSVRVQVEHTLFHPIDTVTINVERLNGHMVATPGHLISLDDTESYAVHIDQAVTRLSAHDLTTMVNSYLLHQAGSAVRRVDLSFEGQQLVLKGKVHKVVNLPFEAHGMLSATPEGDLRLHMDDFRVAGVLSKSFLEFLGIRLDNVAQPKRAATYRIEGDDFITPLDHLFPPPLVYGHVVRVKVEGQDLVQVIGIEAEQHAIQTIPKALPDPPNYVYFTGGRMRFGKVTMDNVDLKLVNLSPSESFDFSLKQYQRQIQAGYVKVTPALGLVVYAKNFSELEATR